MTDSGGEPQRHRWDLVMSNPPYIPFSKGGQLSDKTEGRPDQGGSQLWCGGTELIQWMFQEMQNLVNPGGHLVTYFSSVSWLDKTVVQALEKATKPKAEG